MKIITRARLTGLAGAATAVVLAATSFPTPAYAAESPATLAEKAAALRALGLEPTAIRTGYKDCDLTIEIWNALAGQKFRGEVRTAAVTAYTDPASLAGDASKCTLFLRTEVFAAKQRDVAIQIAAEEQDRVERELKQKAALTIGLTVSTDDLSLTLKNFVDLIRKSDEAGTRVKAGAQAAYDASAAEQMTFLGDGIVTAHEADRKKQIEDEAAGNKALELKLIEEAARKRALAVLLVAATDGMLAASDRDFITYIWENAAQGTEVRGAAERAVLSREPADWNNYIHTGIHEAREADRQLAIRKKYEADVAKANAILAEANAAGQHILAVAARKALAGSVAELDQFIRTGQYDLNLVTGFEEGEVPLEWTDSPAWTGAFNSVNNCNSSWYTPDIAAEDKTIADLRAQLAATRAQLKAEQAKPRPSPALIDKLKMMIPSLEVEINSAIARKAALQAQLNACMATTPASQPYVGWGRTGKRSVEIHGYDHSATRSYAYFRALPLSRVTVKPTTTLTYWVFPDSFDPSSCVAVDLVFSDGSNLRDSGAVDQNGNRAHPARQCGKLKMRAWNKITVNLGDRFNGRAINTVVLAYDQPANTGFFRATFDDISITE